MRRGIFIQLATSELAQNLSDYLASRDCEVERLEGGRLGVAVGEHAVLAAAKARTRAGLCYRCGDTLTEMLEHLGSPLCLDCRGELGAEATARARRELARLQLASYLTAWQARHPMARAQLIA